MSAPRKRAIASVAGMALAVALTGLGCAVTNVAKEPPVAEPDVTYRMIILSDRTGGHTEGVYPSIIDEINLLKPDIVVTVGDQIEGVTENMEAASAEWDSVLVFLGEIEAPYYLTAGNHDIWSDESRSLYTRKTGFAPYYSFDHKNTHFVVLDNSRLASWSDIPGEQLTWLTQDLSTHREAARTFVFYHKPFWEASTANGHADCVHDLLVEYGVDAVFTGHYHHYFVGEYDGILYSSIGSSGGHMYRQDRQPVARGEFFQFAWVTVSDGGHDLAVIHAGSVYPWDVNTVANEREISRIEGSLVSVSSVSLAEVAHEWMDVTVTIANEGIVAVRDEADWSLPDDWVADPESFDVDVAPGETGEFSVRMLNSGELYPVPDFSVTYPLTNGRAIEATVPLRVVRSASAHELLPAPRIDAAADDWPESAFISRFYPAYEDYEVEGKTAFGFGHDARNLYVMVVCDDPEAKSIQAAVEKRDGPVYADDCVGFFFQPDREEMVVYQVYVNPLGTVFDQRISFDENMRYTVDASWDGEYEIACRMTDGGWRAEMRMAFSEFGVRAGETAIWGLNFRRKQHRTQSQADWQVPIDYNPRSFGELILE